MDSVRQLLRITHRLDPDERDDFDILSMIRADEIRRLSSQWLQGLARILTAITLSIGGAGIFAVSYLNVNDRIGEIGLRMAVGATRGSIAALFRRRGLCARAAWRIGRLRTGHRIQCSGALDRDDSGVQLCSIDASSLITLLVVVLVDAWSSATGRPSWLRACNPLSHSSRVGRPHVHCHN